MTLAAISGLQFLAEASELLSSSLDYEKTLARVAQLAVPRIADWCAVDVVNEGGQIQRLAVTHIDPRKIQFAHEVEEKYPPDPNALTGLPQVLRTGRSEFYAEIPQEMLQFAAVNEEHLRLINELGLVSAMVVPLIARKIVFGAITFVSAESKRHFTEEDLQLAEDLGRRAAMAVDNAWLYRKSQEELEERKEVEVALRSSEIRFRTMIEQSPLGIQIFDIEGNCVEVNHAWEELWVASSEELKDYNIRKDPLFEARGLKQFVEQAYDGKAVTLPTILYDPAELGRSGRPRWIRTFMYPVRDDGQEVKEVAVILEDVTERREADEELRHAKERAEANERELDVANQAKDRFLAILSHELRAPLTPIMATAEALQAEQIPDELRPWLDIIQRNVVLEARLIDDLLDLTRISKGKLQLSHETVDLHTLLYETIEMYRSDINAKNLRTELELDAQKYFVNGDPARLQQIFWNLIKNAEKFTPEGGMISVRSSNIPDDKIRIEIVDTGIGIDPVLLPRIFDAFEQGEQMRAFGGMGLGLSISKSLVEAHGGTIVATSSGKGNGSTFIVELMTVQAPTNTTAHSSVKDVQVKGHKPVILLIDDHADTRAAVKMLLERQGFIVRVASSAADAIRVIKEAPVDLIISDIGLPDESGLTMLPKLHAISKAPAIALSGFGSESDMQRSREAGFQEHLTKPFNMRELRETIAKLLEMPQT